MFNTNSPWVARLTRSRESPNRVWSIGCSWVWSLSWRGSPELSRSHPARALERWAPTLRQQCFGKRWSPKIPIFWSKSPSNLHHLSTLASAISFSQTGQRHLSAVNTKSGEKKKKKISPFENLESSRSPNGRRSSYLCGKYRARGPIIREWISTARAIRRRRFRYDFE